MDFRTKFYNGTYAVRASAIIIQNNKIYLIKSSDNYYLPGGAINFREDTSVAVKREVKEELNVAVTIDKLAFIIENQFELRGNPYHQIEFHYMVTPLSDLSLDLIEDGKHKECEWIDLDDIDKIRLNPAVLKTELKNWDGQLKFLTNKMLQERGKEIK